MNEELEGKYRLRRKTNIAFDPAEFAVKIKAGDLSYLAKGITLIESRHPKHFEQGRELLQHLQPSAGRSLRIGITGIPGAGKSTFIEKLGVRLCNKGMKIAVLAIDPSSNVNKGSILGDKTRMEKLAREPKAFIRPSPSGGALGGVNRKTREVVLLCEAAGFDYIFIETVGVGQTEVTVRTMVDMFILLTITGGGDELQGIKKGTIELADLILITKADGDNLEKALRTKNDFNRFLKLIQSYTPLWKTKALACSAETGEGMEEVREEIESFYQHLLKNNLFEERRNQQTKDWLMSSITERLEHTFFQDEQIKKALPALTEEVTSGKMPVAVAVDRLLKLFQRKEV